MTRIQPIRDQDLLEACAFMNRSLNAQLPASEWTMAFRHGWSAETPNHGFMLLGPDGIVGTLGAIYSDQQIRGRIEKFCNLTGWSVLEDYRTESLPLMRAALSQKGYTFTSFTPSPPLVAVYRGLRFVPIDGRRWMVPCVPWLPPTGAKVISDPAAIERSLGEPAAHIFRDHAKLHDIGQVALESESGCGLILYRRRRRKWHTNIEVLHLEDGASFLVHHRTLARHWARVEGAQSMAVPARLLPGRPWPSLAASDPQPRLYLSRTLRPDDITLLYSEVVALNI